MAEYMLSDMSDLEHMSVSPPVKKRKMKKVGLKKVAVNESDKPSVSISKKKVKPKSNAGAETAVQMSDDNRSKQPQVIKQIIPDCDIQVVVYKTHMAISQFEIDPTGQIRCVSCRSVMLSCSMLVKLNLIAPTILEWIDGCEKTWQESNFFADWAVDYIYYLNLT